jgi:DNA-binding NarL/FixJ family response regulator
VIRVAIAEDHALVREGIRRVLELSRKIVVVGEANDGREAVALALRTQPDVLLLDVRMPVVGGLDVLRELGPAAPPTIVLTTFDDPAACVSLIRAGAKGYLLKSVNSRSLLVAIEAVVSGGTYFQPAFGETTRRALEDPGLDRPFEELTPREREVLRLLAGGHSNREIGQLLGMAEGTAKNHVSTILDKLGVRDRTRAVLAALERRLI